MNSINDGNDRAQAHTLEAFAAAILLVAGLTFALQATAVTPLSASTSNQHIENQQRALAGDLLATSAENGDLEAALLYWDPDGGDGNGTFVGTGASGAYTGGGPPNTFGETLNQTFLDRTIAFNVVIYHGERNENRTRMVNMGSPSDNAVTATRSVGLPDGANLTAPGHRDTTLRRLADDTDPGAFYVEDDVVADTAMYDYVEVRIVVWRM
ncbi:DUF7288 family protein [Halorubrum halophilum]|uniref:DUF7288 family protein n=1 Tax=Halorubrum halophilum TaxID=413816 RepID=UPI000679A263|nr:hypothetical protein [Halorubrum halophilum]